MKMSKWVMMLGVVAAALIGISLMKDGGDGARPEKTRVRIGDLPVSVSLPLYVALEKGYFEDEGLEAERVKFEAPNQIVDALMAGTVDLTSPGGAMGIMGVANFKNPGKIKIYAASGGTVETPFDSILVKTGSPIATVPDLKGKRLGILPGIQWRTIARHILAQSGLLAEKDVTIVELSPALQAQALASGDVDALLGVEPIPTIVKAKKIGKEIVHGAAERAIVEPFYPGAGGVNLAFAKENPETMRKVMAVFERAIKDIEANPLAAQRYLAGYTALDASLAAQTPVPIFKMAKDFDGADIAAIQKFYDIFGTYKVIDGAMDARDILYHAPGIR